MYGSHRAVGFKGVKTEYKDFLLSIQLQSFAPSTPHPRPCPLTAICWQAKALGLEGLGGLPPVLGE